MRFADRSCSHSSEHNLGSVLPSISPAQKGDTMAGGRESRLSLHGHTPA